MNILKKGSAITVSVICMLVIAGYINYEYNPEREKNLGKTVYVSAGQGEVVKVTNDDKKEEGSQHGYIFVGSSNNLDIQDIKDNIKRVEQMLQEKGGSFLVTYNEEEKKYYIYIDSSISESDVINIINSINLTSEDVVIKKNK